MNKKSHTGKFNNFFAVLLQKIVITTLLSLLLISCGSEQIPLSKAPLAGATIGGDFSLSDQNGKIRTYKEFDGQYRIIYFGYTSCPDICSPDMQNLMAGLIEFENDEAKLASKIQPIFISIDPKRDTAATLRQFVDSFHPRLIGLRGSDEQTAETAKKFAVIYNKIEPTKGIIDPDNNYLMGHSQMAYLMAPDGSPLALLPLDNPNTDIDEGSPKLVMQELTKWVR